MRNTKKVQANYVSKSREPVKLQTQYASQQSPLSAPTNLNYSTVYSVKAAYYGLADRLLLNVTERVIQACINDTQESGCWAMPSDDLMCASLFGDPIPNVLKKVYLVVEQLDDEGMANSIFLSKESYAFTYFDGALKVHGAI
jgi:hypothetical protein